MNENKMNEEFTSNEKENFIYNEIKSLVYDDNGKWMTTNICLNFCHRKRRS